MRTDTALVRWARILVTACVLGQLLGTAALAEQPTTLELHPAERQPAPVVVTTDGTPLAVDQGYEVEIAVETEEQLAALHTIGVACLALGACRMSVSGEQLSALKGLGPAYRQVGGAIKVMSGEADDVARETRLSGAQLATLGAAWVTASQPADYPISDRTPTQVGFARSTVVIGGLPAGARVTQVKYKLRVAHDYPGDLTLVIEHDARQLNVWNRLGGANDGGYDDDPETDKDIELDRQDDVFFDGAFAGGPWHLLAYDWSMGAVGTIDHFELAVGYSVEEVFSQGWGAAGDILVPGDWDGDSRVDLIVWRPSLGKWYVLTSSSAYSSYWTKVWGAAGDSPLCGDLDGDGRGDLVVWRANTGTWYILYSSKGYNYGDAKTYRWGLAGDLPLLMDTNGDKRQDLVVYRPSTGRWYFKTLPPVPVG
ncbi:MAG: hypothetical protein FJZ90_13120 [Chloroflexi bacterium]|nr:hypothetical protein [Chloroflexota bacterium]